MTEFRAATEDDLPAIVRLLADDPLGATRERDEVPLPEAYRAAFRAIEAQAGNSVILAVEAGAAIGCLQLTVIPGLARFGMKRGRFEAVRIDRRHRGEGLGAAPVRRAIELARREGRALVRLTTDKSRPDARRFTERLGFTASHEGMKLSL